MNRTRSDYIRPLCQSGDPEDWFAQPGSVASNRAKSVCMDCPLYWGCQAYALEQGIPYGVWGGLDERQRARAWHRAGDKPTAFTDSIDAVIGPLLNARGAREAWARRTEEEDEDPPFTYDFSAEGPDAA